MRRWQTLERSSLNLTLIWCRKALDVFTDVQQPDPSDRNPAAGLEE